MKKVVLLLLIGMGPLLAQQLSAPLSNEKTPQPEQRPTGPQKSEGGLSFDRANEAVGGVVDLARDHNWQQHTEIKTGNIYWLRRSTEEPVKPGETVILRWRTPSEFKRKDFVYARNPRALVERKKTE